MFNAYLDMWAAWKIGGWLGKYLLAPALFAALVWFLAPVMLVWFLAYIAHDPIVSFFKRHAHVKQSFS